MPKLFAEKYEEGCRRLWLLAHKKHPDWSIEKIYLDILCEEFEGAIHEFRKTRGKKWPANQQPKLSWFTRRIATKWKAQEVPEPTEEPLLQPWDEDWGDDPERIRTLTVLFGLANEIYHSQDQIPVLKENGIKFAFNGIPAHVCDWACKLNRFFDLEDQYHCLCLLHIAYVFANDETNAKLFEEPIGFEYDSFKLLLEWQKRDQEPLVAKNTSMVDVPVSFPIWERRNQDDMIWAVALHLANKPWVKPSIITGIDPQNVISNQTPTVVPMGEPSTPNKLLDQLRSQGLPIDEDHAALGMVYTNPPDQQEPEVVEEGLLDGAYRVIGMSTTDQMIMPIEPSTANDARNSLTQDAVLELVSDLLQNPGTLSRERAAELGMNLVATFDEILNRHENKEE